MGKKIAVHICTGCGLGEGLDTEALVSAALAERDVVAVESRDLLCGEASVAAIRSDLDALEADTVVIAACSPRVLAEAFSFGEGRICERVNLREQVLWCHPAGDEDTQMLAEDQLRMGIVRARESVSPVPSVPEDPSRRILVVGAGLTGLAAASDAAGAGYEVVLVEKGPSLGGYLKDARTVPPSEAPWEEVKAFDISDLASEVVEHPRITVHTGAQVARIAGAPCLFNADIRIEGTGETVPERVGAVVLATGATPYPAERLESFGWGKSPDVITTLDLDRMLTAGEVRRPSNGEPVGSAAFVLCAGSRDPQHLPYCSSACCADSLRQAKLLKSANPAMPVYVIYRDMRTPGRLELFYKQLQKDGVVFVRGRIAAVEDDGAGGLVLVADDVLTRSPVMTESVELVVLANGMVSTADAALATGGAEDGEGASESCAAGRAGAEGFGLLNLDYRQGPELPLLKYGFPDSHFVCFPYESRRTGIYPAGTVRAPMDSASAREDAAGAALKAIQCVEMTARGGAVHPRAGDLSFPEFFMQRCTQCKRCTEECPFGAINEDEKANPLPNPTRCRRCGVCMGACPERIISFSNYSVGMIGNMIKAVRVPDEYEEKPRILVLTCENDAYPALDMAGLRRLTYNAWVRIIPLRCLGSLNLVWIADALSKGIDGILLLGCRHGDDYQCHFIKGSELASIRMSKVRETLDRLVLESDRVRVEEVAISDYGKLPGILDDFAARLAELGPNPYKGY